MRVAVVCRALCEWVTLTNHDVVRAEAAGMKVSEVPISFVDRVFGESKLGAMEVIGYLKGLAQLAVTV